VRLHVRKNLNVTKLFLLKKAVSMRTARSRNGCVCR